MIPRIPTGKFTGKEWSTDGAGKGSEPRNLSDQFRDNFQTISGLGQLPKSENGHTRFLRVDGRRAAIIVQGGKEVTVFLE